MIVEQLLSEIFEWRARAYRAEAERDEANLRAARDKRRVEEIEQAFADLAQAYVPAMQEDEVEPGVDQVQHIVETADDADEESIAA